MSVIDRRWRRVKVFCGYTSASLLRLHRDGECKSSAVELIPRVQVFCGYTLFLPAKRSRQKKIPDFSSRFSNKNEQVV